MDAARPKVCQSFRAPNHKGSEGRVTGVDFVGKYTSSSSAYTIQTFALNARNSTVFPRLSAIATVWRRYYFKQLRFHLFGIAAATQRGYTAMSSLVTDDLATLITPTTESQILNQEQVAIGRPWSYVVHDVNLGGLGLEWYTCDAGDGPSEFGEYIGRAFLGIPQTTSDSDIEIQVYVEYDVEFCQRVAASLDPICSQLGGRITGGGSLSTTNVLGTAAVVDAQASGLSVNGSGQVSFADAGTYVVWASASGSSLTSPSAITGTGITSISSVAIVNAGASTALWGIVLSATAGANLNALAVSGGTVSSSTMYVGLAPTNSLSVPILNHQPDDFLDQVARLRLRMQEAKLV